MKAKKSYLYQKLGVSTVKMQVTELKKAILSREERLIESAQDSWGVIKQLTDELQHMRKELTRKEEQLSSKLKQVEK